MDQVQVQIHHSTIIAQGNSNTPPTETQLTIFDRFASDINIACLFAFTPPTPPNSVIIAGLTKTLTHFPTLTGQITKTRLLVGSPDGGVLVVEATVSSTLADHLPLEPSPYLELLHPTWRGAHHVFQVQLNRFRCGGLVVGITAHHRVADGLSMSNFFVAWGQTVRGDAVVDRLPTYDRSWLVPHDPPQPQFQHWCREFIPTPSHPDETFFIKKTNVDPDKITNILLHYSQDFIKKELKTRISNKHTTFELLLGHLWRKVTIARGLDGEDDTMVKVCVNGRPRLRPPVTSEFFGNLVLNAYPKAKAKDLVEGGLAGAARIVHDAIARIDDDYFRSFMDFGAMYEEEELVPVYDEDGNMLLPNMEVDSWLGFKFQEVDFGCGGKLCAFLPTWVPIDGLAIFLQSLRPDGGIDIMVGLLEESARKLKEISHTLD